MKNRKAFLRQDELFICGTALGYSHMGLTLQHISRSPFVLNGLERLICLVILGLSRRSFRLRRNRRTIPGAIFMYLSAVIFVLANRLTTTANAVFLQYTNPVFVILFSWAFLGKRPTARDALVTLGMLGGMAMFFLGDLSPGSLPGNILAIFSGVAMALGNLYTHHSGVDVREYGMNSCVLSIVVGLLACIWQPPRLTASTLASIAFYGVFCTGIPLVLMAKGAPHVEPLKISMLMMIEPVCGPLWVALATSQWPSGTALAGGGMVLACLVLNLCIRPPEENKATRTEGSNHGNNSDSGGPGL